MPFFLYILRCAQGTMRRAPLSWALTSSEEIEATVQEIRLIFSSRLFILGCAVKIK